MLAIELPLPCEGSRRRGRPGAVALFMKGSQAIEAFPDVLSLVSHEHGIKRVHNVVERFRKLKLS